ncbi:Beta sliding clamp (Beta clamp) (Sliding clamp) (Beta-clamp processivity factor) (DNA polymerase III beta sliding clamp subunit) (DNA polymerase III subunit beta) [Durusdinium trenchii]|uniref:Beta sliding clamp (Beta clamp) (Sliding clamp) (Beta-clamp processivity factor) (DNA polymerase III beta sliding clamp subunit) (DNA polymerase III subunit beta) n=2 Tax=Durusdinium trenchii TaxID=1381693 RepID=A0ABP0PQE2_9DINO
MAGNIHRPPRDRDILKFYGIVLRVAGVFITASGAVWLIRAGLAGAQRVYFPDDSEAALCALQEAALGLDERLILNSWPLDHRLAACSAATSTSLLEGVDGEDQYEARISAAVTIFSQLLAPLGEGALTDAMMRLRLLHDPRSRALLVAIAAVAAAKRFALDAGEIVLTCPAHERNHSARSVSYARKCVAIAIARANHGRAEEIAFKLNWHKTLNSAQATFSRCRKRAEPKEKDVKAIYEALHAAGLYRAKAKPEKKPDAAMPAEDSAKDPEPAVNGGDAIARDADTKRPEPAAPPRPAEPPATADYSNMTEAEIAEHEQCEALLRSADRKSMKDEYCIVNAHKLAEILEPVKLIVETRNTIPILSHILLEWREDAQKLKITATDLDLDYSVELVGMGDAGSFLITVPAMEFRNFVKVAASGKRGPDVPLRIEVGDLVHADRRDRLVEISSGMVCLSLVSMDPADFPLISIDDLTPDAEEELGKSFLEALTWCSRTASVEETRYYLNGVFVHCTDAGVMRCVATDGHRLSMQRVEDGIEHDFAGSIIPSKAVRVIIATGRVPSWMTVFTEKGKIRMRFDGAEIIMKLIDGKFPEYQRVIPDPETCLPGVTVKSNALLKAANGLRTVKRPDLPVRYDEDDFDAWGDDAEDCEEPASWRITIKMPLDAKSELLSLGAGPNEIPEQVARAAIKAEYEDGASGRIGIECTYLVDLLSDAFGLVKISPSSLGDGDVPADMATGPDLAEIRTDGEVIVGRFEGMESFVPLDTAKVREGSARGVRMMIYVDSAKNRLGRMIMSHMTADTMVELLEAADGVGLKREWFQGPPQHRHAHFDLCQAKRRALIEDFTVEIVSSRELARHARRLADDIKGRSPQSKYNTMSLSEIRALPMREIAARDCILFLWAWSPMLVDAVRLLEDWRFDFVTSGAWAKRSETGRHWAMGNGYYLRGACEYFLIGKRGNPKVRDKSVRNLFAPPDPRDLEPIDGGEGGDCHSPDSLEDLVDGRVCRASDRAVRADAAAGLVGMSGLLFGTVFASGLYKGADLTVLLKLADYADDNAVCWCGYPTLARMTGLEERSVMRIVKRLVEDGRDEERGIPGTIRKIGKGGRGRSNKYEINLMRLEAAKLVWYRNPDYPSRFKSFVDMASDPEFRPRLEKALPGLPPLPGKAIEKGDAKKGDSDDTGSAGEKGDTNDSVLNSRKGDSDSAKGDSDAANPDSGSAQTVPGESPESLIESILDSGAHARASDETARAAPSQDDWRAVRRQLKEGLGEQAYADCIARLRYAGHGRIIAPNPDYLDHAVRQAGKALKAAGFVLITSEGGGREALVEHFKQMIKDQEALIAALDARPAQIIDELVKARARHDRHVEAADRLEQMIFAGAETDGEDKIAERMRKLTNRRKWIDRAAAQVSDLERAKAGIGALELQAEQARERLARLKDDLETGQSINETAARSGLMAVRRAAEDDAAEIDAKRLERASRVTSDRDRPTKESIARRGVRTRTREGAIVLDTDLPDPILRMKRAGFAFENDELKAAAFYREDYRFGLERSKMVATYEPGVQGGSAPGEIATAKLDAYERHRAAAAALPDHVRRVVDAVLLQEVELVNIGGVASRYKGEKSRRSVNGGLLTVGLELLSSHYFNK